MWPASNWVTSGKCSIGRQMCRCPGMPKMLRPMPTCGPQPRSREKRSSRCMRCIGPCRRNDRGAHTRFTGPSSVVDRRAAAGHAAPNHGACHGRNRSERRARRHHHEFIDGAAGDNDGNLPDQTAQEWATYRLRLEEAGRKLRSGRELHDLCQPRTTTDPHAYRGSAGYTSAPECCRRDPRLRL